ncbi:hypothetical protein D3C84_703450 [compost metagenome]
MRWLTSASATPASATSLRAWRLALLGISWVRPMACMVIVSRSNFQALSLSTGRLRTPRLSLGSGSSPAGMAA